MKKYFCILLITLLSFSLQAQENSHVVKTFKIGLFVPIYLDSIFKRNIYQYYKKFPKFSFQGIEYVHGAQIALKMFPPSKPTELFIYDIKSDSQSVEHLIQTEKLEQLDIMLGVVKESDIIQLANFAKVHQIPFVSISHPNDCGITNNPFYYILNSTLKTHCSAIISFLIQNHANDNILLVTKKGSQEEKIYNYLKEFNSPDGFDLLKIKTFTYDSVFIPIKNNLDSTKKNMIIAASLDEDFANELYNYANTFTQTNYDIMMMGMPNWDGFDFLKKTSKAAKKIPVCYSTSFYINKADTSNMAKMFRFEYKNNYKTIPSDYAYKGLEFISFFTSLYSNYQDDYILNINNNNSPYLVNYNFKKTKTSIKSNVFDYYENKKLYFIKKQNGVTSLVW